MNDQEADAYNASVGAVMKARTDYENACSAFGAESWGAEQAKEYLDRQIIHRNEMRVRHDDAEGGHSHG